jgi:hypothetical protein
MRLGGVPEGHHTCAMIHAPTFERLDDSSRECVRACYECHFACTQTIMYCTERKNLTLERIGVLQDCAEVALSTAHFVIRLSPYQPHTRALCAEICDQAAETLDGAKKDPQLKACADICRTTAQACRAI